MSILIGTSGWQYRDWSGILYPPQTPQRRWLEEYAAAFATVEINATFYRLPARTTFAGWRERTPDDFVAAVKASRYLTHVKRLQDPQEAVERFLAAASGLGDRLGPVLLQLPPTLHADVRALEDCLRCFSALTPVAVELRHPSWYTPETREVLQRHGAALCWADRGSRPVTPLWATGPFGYVRFHGGAGARWRYGRRALAKWIERIGDGWPAGAVVYAYFNNDAGGAALYDAVAFAHMAERTGLTVSRTPRIPKAIAE